MGVEPEGGVAVGAGVLPAAPPPPITTKFSYNKKSYHVRCRSDLTPFPILVMHQIQYHVPELFLHFKTVGHIASINVRWHSSDQHTKSLTIIAG